MFYSFLLDPELVHTVARLHVSLVTMKTSVPNQIHTVMSRLDTHTTVRDTTVGTQINAIWKEGIVLFNDALIVNKILSPKHINLTFIYDIHNINILYFIIKYDRITWI